MLPDLDLLLTMDGLSRSGIAKEVKMVSLMKRADILLKWLDTQPPSQEFTPAAAKQMQRLWTGMREQGLLDAIPDFDRDFSAALAGDQTAIASLGKTSLWQFAEAVFPRANWLGESAAHCAEVERASQMALLLLRAGDHAALANEIETNSTLCLYFKPKALILLRSALSAEQVLAVRILALCEFLLGQWVRLASVWATHLSDEALIDTQRALLAVSPDGLINPGRAFFQWFKNELGAKTIAHILELAQLQSKDPTDKWLDESTLKRWSSGRVFPSDKAFKELLKHLASGWGDRDLRTLRTRRIVAHYFLARRLDTLMDFVQCLMPTRPAKQLDASLFTLLEAPTMNEWLGTGFEKWLTHWRESAAEPIGLA